MLTLIVLAALTVSGALAAMSLRNLVHCALALAVSFTGLAAVYLQLDAQFVGFAQILIYVGAVAILIVFAILLTRDSGAPGQPILSPTWLAGIGVAVAVFALLAGLVLSSNAARRSLPPAPDVSVTQIGSRLMTHYILPLEVIGLLLTAALIGAVLLASHEQRTQ
jgi:NADH-quinone oxidoreductase subunit J